MTVDYMPPLDIKQRIVEFNRTNDWSVFSDVPEHQSISIMYPHLLDLDAYILSAFKYVVYECDPDDEHKFISKIIYQSDILDDVDFVAYEQSKKDGKAYVIFQPKLSAIRGGYGWKAEGDA